VHRTQRIATCCLAGGDVGFARDRRAHEVRWLHVKVPRGFVDRVVDDDRSPGGLLSLRREPSGDARQNLRARGREPVAFHGAPNTDVQARHDFLDLDGHRHAAADTCARVCRYRRGA
jgi:hypothetical protein